MNNPVEQFNNNRKSEAATLIVAVLMATGVNFFVSGIAMTERKRSCLFVIAGLIVIILSLILFRYQSIKSNFSHKRFRGFFIYNVEKRELVDIPNYDIALRMCNCMRSSSDEIKKVWKSQALGNIQFMSGKFCEEITESHRIISELLEFCVLEILSTSLPGYYGATNKSKFKVLGRNDVPDILQNRFLYWYSQEPEGIDDIKEYLEMYGCTSEETIRKSAKEAKSRKPYSRFELVLPKCTTISRNGDKIVINDPLFSLTIKCSYDECNALTPMNFKKEYLRIDENDSNIKSFSMSVYVDVKFKVVKCLISSKKIKDYAWIDYFLNELDQMISEDYYYNKIGWGTAETVIRCINERGGL